MATPRLLKRIMASQPFQWIGSAIGAGYVVLVRWTSRIDLPPVPTQDAVILAMWHGRLAMLHLLRFGKRPMVALISGHRDGQLISKCAWYFDIRTVTGSSTRGGIGAARKLIRLAHDGHSLFITPDGPRGPCREVNEGILDLSLLTGLAILPVSISTSGGKVLATWDEFLVPRPFSRIAVRWGEPFRVRRDDDPAVTSSRLQATLNALQQSADLAAGRVAEQTGQAGTSR
jgi:lysophospholipid acyltransferase (LPLAT)-like uncharacterized protein